MTPSTPAADSKTPGVDWGKGGAKECKEGGWVNGGRDGAPLSTGEASQHKPPPKLASAPKDEPVEQVIIPTIFSHTTPSTDPID